MNLAKKEIRFLEKESKKKLEEVYNLLEKLEEKFEFGSEAYDLILEAESKITESMLLNNIAERLQK